MEQVSAGVGGQVVIPVIEESVAVTTELQHTGSVRISKRIVEDRAVRLVSTYEEAVEVERVPINRVVAVAAEPHHRGDTLIVPVHEERWVKEIVLVEELHIVKRRTRNLDEHSVPLRREEVVVERFDPATQTWQLEQGEGAVTRRRGGEIAASRTVISDAEPSPSFVSPASPVFPSTTSTTESKTS